MSDKTFTQEEVNALMGKAREEGRTAKAKEFEGWISPDEFENKAKDLNNKLAEVTSALHNANEEIAESKKSIAEKEQEIKGYELHSVKTRIAHEIGLTWDAVEFLQGDDEATVRKSAETLKHLVGVGNVQPMANPEPPVGDSSTEALRGMLQSMRGE